MCLCPPIERILRAKAGSIPAGRACIDHVVERRSIALEARPLVSGQNHRRNHQRGASISVQRNLAALTPERVGSPAGSSLVRQWREIFIARTGTPRARARDGGRTR
jgi:hypothetical protein